MGLQLVVYKPEPPSALPTGGGYHNILPGRGLVGIEADGLLGRRADDGQRAAQEQFFGGFGRAGQRRIGPR
jgi:hypothetical protein